jgi:MerR family redox-sensitive transcriptional activator SoxR
MTMNSFDWHEARLTVGQVADRSGASQSALRFYERQGLISADRTAGNQRRYRGDVLCRVAMIQVCQQAGLSLAQTGTALAEAVPDGQIPGPREWEALARRLRHQLTTRIDELDRLLAELGHTGEPG